MAGRLLFLMFIICLFYGLYDTDNRNDDTDNRHHNTNNTHDNSKHLMYLSLYFPSLTTSKGTGSSQDVPVTIEKSKLGKPAKSRLSEQKQKADDGNRKSRPLKNLGNGGVQHSVFSIVPESYQAICTAQKIIDEQI